MDVLGLWDGHDCGAAIVRDGKLIVAVNEERFSRKKLDVGFPAESIKQCLKQAELKPSDITHIAYNTSDFSKTLTRLNPGLKYRYYLLRRRMIPRPFFETFFRWFKFFSTEIPEVPFSRRISESYFRRNLDKLGFKGYKLHYVPHHKSHAASAVLTSGFKKSLVVTLDGVGDALSGTISVFEDGELNEISRIKARDSFGIFYEQVTTLMGMRELEDEGKVMALSNFSYQIPDEKNKLIDFFEVDKLNVKSRYGALSRFERLKDVFWNTPREEIAYMTQRTLEKHATQLFENALEETGVSDVAWSGGVASNIKLNMNVRHLDGLKNWHVFPHMGDGGLAAGCALYVSNKIEGVKPYKIQDCYLGIIHDPESVEEAVKSSGLEYEQRTDSPKYAGELISSGEYVFWWQDRMEFGPRALGNRSILAPAGDIEVKDRLNLGVKMRSWFQPFCPSILSEDCKKIFEDMDSVDSFMTMGYQVKPDKMVDTISVVNVDGSARPQMLGDENQRYRLLMESVKDSLGIGLVLNTSFNLHGFPIVNTPDEALEVQMKTKTEHLFLGDYVVWLK